MTDAISLDEETIVNTTVGEETPTVTELSEIKISDSETVQEQQEQPVEQKETTVTSIDADDLRGQELKDKIRRVNFDFPISSSILETDNSEPISLPSSTGKDVKEIISSIPNVELGGDEDREPWADTLTKSFGLASYDDIFVDSLESENKDFGQIVETPTGKIHSHKLNFQEKAGSSFDGEIAVLRTMSYLGMGDVFNTCLYNTGMWIQFKPPSEEALIELYRQLTADNVELGRSSYGLAFSNGGAFTTERICRFAVDHIYSIGGSPEINSKNLLDLIRVQDINSIMYGLASTMFPNGFKYSRSCIADPTKCKFVCEETLHVRKTQFVDRKALTPKQKAHLAFHRSQNKLTTKDLENYTLELDQALGHRFTVNKGMKDEITFELTSPSINAHITASHLWIDELTSNVEEALGSKTTPEQRNEQINLRANATVLRQYSHWVKSIEFGNGENANKIESSAIPKVLASLSSNKLVREEFFKQVRLFIEKSTVSVIGIRTFECPSCNKINKSVENFPLKDSVIPLDVTQLFFALVIRKVKEIRNR